MQSALSGPTDWIQRYIKPYLFFLPAYPPGGDTSAGSFGNGLPFCAMHMRVSSVSLPYLQNRLHSLIISAILAQYSSLCDHLVLQFNLG